ncbi:MAG: hypothetical protein HFE79_13790 [Ruminiclostridium sp.]|nr:hypothetical protein [Ruminiclostridium sp.]
MNQNAEWILEKIKIENKLHDIIARTTDKYVTVTYNNQKTTLASALASIFADISLMPTAAGIDEKIEAAKKAVKDNLLGGVVPDTMNTLKKIADYIEMHREAAEALNQAMDNKVDKVEGKGLSTEDFTAEFKAILEALPAITAENVDNWNNKVDKIPGKGLSSNDFTSDEKTKLAELENYDDTTVKADIGAIKTVNERQDTDITNLKTDNANNKTNIHSLQTKADELEAEVIQNNGDIAELNSGKVSKSGDTMTGRLSFSTPNQRNQLGADLGNDVSVNSDMRKNSDETLEYVLYLSNGSTSETPPKEKFTAFRHMAKEGGIAELSVQTDRMGITEKNLGAETRRWNNIYVNKVNFADGTTMETASGGTESNLDKALKAELKNNIYEITSNSTYIVSLGALSKPFPYMYVNSLLFGYEGSPFYALNLANIHLYSGTSASGQAKYHALVRLDYIEFYEKYYFANILTIEDNDKEDIVLGPNQVIQFLSQSAPIANGFIITGTTFDGYLGEEDLFFRFVYSINNNIVKGDLYIKNVSNRSVTINYEKIKYLRLR